MNKNKLSIIIFFTLWSIFFIWFWINSIYFDNEGNLTSATPMIWADWAMHSSQVHSFYYRGLRESLNNNHIYAYSPLTYPFITNLLSAILMKLGLGIIPALILPSIFFSILLLISLYRFGKVLFNDSKIAILGSSIFLTGGGLGFIYFIQDFIAKPNISLFINPPREYTRLIPQNIHWYSTLIATFIPQRAMLMGMPLAILLLTFILKKYKNNFSNITNLGLFIYGVFCGSLVWIHTHSFIALFFICLVLFTFRIKNFSRWLFIGLGSFIPCIPFLIRLKNANLDSFLQWYPGWLAHNPEIEVSWLTFWILNWGLFIPIFIIALLALYKTKNTLAKRIAISFILLFFISNLFIFQPSDWDNVKLLMWVYCGFSFYIAWWLIIKIKAKFYNKYIMGVLLLVLSFSGILDLFYLLNFQKHTHVMITNQEISLAKSLIEKTDPNSIILTSDDHLHWVPVMTGRPILMGYRGWLWSYGIDYSQRERDIDDIYLGRDNAKSLLAKYQIKYVVIGPDEKEKYPVDVEFFKNNYPLLLSNKDTLVFDTRFVMMGK